MSMKKKLQLYYNVVKNNRIRVELINKRYHKGCCPKSGPIVPDGTYCVYEAEYYSWDCTPLTVLAFSCCDKLFKRLYFSNVDNKWVTDRVTCTDSKKPHYYLGVTKYTEYTFSDINTLVTWFIDLCQRDVSFSYFRESKYWYRRDRPKNNRRLFPRCPCYKNNKGIQCYDRFVIVPTLNSICTHMIRSLFYNKSKLIRSILPPNFPEVFVMENGF
jgi:hypothetical protein